MRTSIAWISLLSAMALMACSGDDSLGSSGTGVEGNGSGGSTGTGGSQGATGGSTSTGSGGSQGGTGGASTGSGGGAVQLEAGAAGSGNGSGGTAGAAGGTDQDGGAADPCATVRCKAGTHCVVVQIECITTPCNPIAECQADKQACGGFAGTACPKGQSCIDDPSDTCDPKNGGADCAGICQISSGCATDADCRLVDDYCGGCKCDALLASEPDPTCSDPVQCLRAPCQGMKVACLEGACQALPAR